MNDTASITFSDADLCNIVRKRIAGLEKNTPQARGGVYRMAVEALIKVLNNVDPPLSEERKEIEIRTFRTLVRAIEADISAGVDIQADEYHPTGISEVRARLEQRLMPKSRPQIMRGGDENQYVNFLDVNNEATNSFLRRLPDLLRQHGEVARMNEKSLMLTRLRCIWAVFNADLKAMGNESRIALAWLFVRPVLFTSLIVAFYYIMGTRQIENMEVPGFAVLGIMSFMLFTQTAVRVASSLHARRNLMILPAIKWIDVMMAEALVYFSIYTLAMVALMAICVYLGIASHPDNIVLFTGIWLSIWASGLLLGMILSSVRAFWPFSIKLMPIFFRIVMIASGIFFVTEQFPSDISYWLLFNPLLHAVQGLRDAYFEGYVSPDVDLRYFFLSVLLMAPFAVILGRSAKSA
jgi:capsular polysaccharide transport system permease protein